MSPVKPIPDGHHTVTPSLVVKGAAAAIDFYKQAFGAVERGRMAGPDGSIMHAEIMIGNSIVFIADESPMMASKSPTTLGGSSGGIHIYTEDCDAMFARAVAAGGTVKMPLTDQFWGDRYGQLIDPFGHIWGVGTHKEDLTPAQMDQRMKEMMAATPQK